MMMKLPQNKNTVLNIPLAAFIVMSFTQNKFIHSFQAYHMRYYYHSTIKVVRGQGRASKTENILLNP